jgi:glycosyltransferase involved in cell wall biosynthesis
LRVDQIRPSGRRALILVEDLPVPFDRRVWTEAKTLRDAGWQMTVISPKGEGAMKWHERIDGIEVFRYPLPTTAAGFVNHLVEYAVAIPATLILALLAWRGRRFDVVHACNPPDFFFPIGWLFQRLGAAFVYDQHDLAPEVYVAQGGRRDGLVHRILRWCERATYRTADVVIATNETYRHFALERGGVDPDRVFVVRSSPDPKRIHRVPPDPSLRDGRPFLVAYLGTMGPQDGVDLLRRGGAARRRRAAGPGAVRRHGRRRHARDAAHQGCGAWPAGRRVLHGPRAGRARPRVLSTADVAVSPDPANDFNEYCTMNKTLEYMATGTAGRGIRPRGDPGLGRRGGAVREAERPADLADSSSSCSTIRHVGSGWPRSAWSAFAGRSAGTSAAAASWRRTGPPWPRGPSNPATMARMHGWGTLSRDRRVLAAVGIGLLALVILAVALLGTSPAPAEPMAIATPSPPGRADRFRPRADRPRRRRPHHRRRPPPPRLHPRRSPASGTRCSCSARTAVRPAGREAPVG